MRPGPAAAADLIQGELPIDAPPRRVREIVSEFVLSRGWADSAQGAQELGERWEDRVLSRLRVTHSEYNRVGRPTTFAFNTSSEYLVQGACFVEGLDSPELVEKKARRLKHSEYRAALKRLSPNQFETLCGKLIGLLGVNDPIVTRSSADEGIDFFGKLSLGGFFYPDDLTPTVQQQLDIWLVGQAKHYQETQAGTPELRELVGSVELGRAKTFGSIRSPLDAMDIRVADPVFLIFVTTGAISTNGWTLLKRSGVIGFDGEMVAAFLADRGAGMGGDEFSTEDFIAWLDT
ncbi:restriction endonuclease [Nitrogeniibacter aestuarii]|uniref:restriction endonuclease n=1 Tax=Nitrogeniibacter aestuarii TaxID=2815343 RepID=UPI001E3A8AA7|nr:restriction endonuclease [Nitrogeniibacter aestuarii]